MKNILNYTDHCRYIMLCVREAIEAYQEKHSLTVEQLADALNLPISVIYAVKNKRSYISPRSVKYFEDILGVIPNVQSHIGSPPTLFNCSQTSGFVYKVIGCDETGMHQLNAMDSFKDIITGIREKYSLKYAGCRNEIFEQNLSMVDSRMDEILQYAMLLRVGYYENKSVNSVSSTCDMLASKNPLSVRNPQAFYKAKFKALLFASFAGMTASEEWSGRKMLTGGYIDVDKDGEMLYYRAISDDVFENYLYQHTYFDQPDRGELKELAVAEGKCFVNKNRHLTELERKAILRKCHGKKGDFGYIYQDGNDYYIVINFQIRFR